MLKGKPHRVIKIYLKYSDNNKPVLSGLERVSKPGLRVYAQRKEIPKVYGGLGIAIVSTPKGVMTGQQAWRQGLGGELLCSIFTTTPGGTVIGIRPTLDIYITLRVSYHI